MAKFFTEMKRRQMFRVAAAYAVGAWLLTKFLNSIAPVVGLPPSAARAALILLVVGLPVVVFWSWRREPARTAAAALDFIILAALLVVIGEEASR